MPTENEFEKIRKEVKDKFISKLSHPDLWSESMIQKVLQRTGSSGYNIQDVQRIIKEYMSVLAESLKKGEHF